MIQTRNVLKLAWTFGRFGLKEGAIVGTILGISSLAGWLFADGAKAGSLLAIALSILETVLFSLLGLVGGLIVGICVAVYLTFANRPIDYTRPPPAAPI